MNNDKQGKLPKGLEHLLEKRDGDRRGKDRRTSKAAAVPGERRQGERRGTSRRKKA